MDSDIEVLLNIGFYVFDVRVCVVYFGMVGVVFVDLYGVFGGEMVEFLMEYFIVGEVGKIGVVLRIFRFGVVVLCLVGNGI